MLSSCRYKRFGMLNNAKKIVKELKTKLPKSKIAFSGPITRKDKKNLDKNVIETKKRLRPILDAVLKQGVLRLFQYGLVRFGTPLF